MCVVTIERGSYETGVVFIGGEGILDALKAGHQVSPYKRVIVEYGGFRWVFEESTHR